MHRDRVRGDGHGARRAGRRGARRAWLQNTRGSRDRRARSASTSRTPTPPTSGCAMPDRRARGPLVLVDDELTTGATAGKLIELLHARARARATWSRAWSTRAAGPGRWRLTAELGVPIDVVALARGAEVAPRGGLERGRAAGAAARAPRRAGPRGLTRLAGAPSTRGRTRGAGGVPTQRDVAADGRAPARGARARLRRAPGLPQLRAAVRPGALMPRRPAAGQICDEPRATRSATGWPSQPRGPSIAGFAYNVHAARRPAIVVHFSEPPTHAAGAARRPGCRRAVAATLAPEITAARRSADRDAAAPAPTTRPTSRCC